MLGIATISIILRLYVRRFMTLPRFELDIYLIIAAWVSTSQSQLTQGTMASQVIVMCVLIYHHVLNFPEATMDELKLVFRVTCALTMLILLGIFLPTDFVHHKLVAHQICPSHFLQSHIFSVMSCCPEFIQAFTK